LNTVRIPIIAANWKMYKTSGEARDFFDTFNMLPKPGTVDVVICPPFPLLSAVGEACRAGGLRLGAQNMYWDTAGAFTGEVSPLLLRDLEVQYVIVGHSERRQLFAETDQNVSRKVKAAFAADLVPIVCVGETLQQRHSGQTEAVVREQVAAALGGLDPSHVRRLVIAYEPVWAIGSGLPATANDAEQVALLIRRQIGDLFSLKVARDVRIQYGGSVKPDNIAEFMAGAEIDGALVGGASLDAAVFAAIIEAGLGARVS
jgi:triosephosphate isomerase (TIM)